MNRNGLYIWIALIIGGFLLGGVMFSRILPKFILKKDICLISPDRNPGSSNVFVSCGIPMGLLCLFLDMMKGFLPVIFAVKTMDIQQLWFMAVLAMPVLGHAIAPFNHFHGGKCIATAFGELIALLPVTPIGLVLAGAYILFSVIIRINPIRKRSIIAFGLLGIISGLLLITSCQYSIYGGCILIAVVAIVRHTKWFCTVPLSTETAGT